MKDASLAICFTLDRSHVLLVKRKDIPIWVLPGGAIDTAETAEQAARRELVEETGLTGKLIRHVATYEPINCIASKTYLFEYRVNTSIQPVPQEETKAVAFFPVNRLPGPLFFLHEEWIQETLKELPFFTKKITSITWKRLFQETIRHPIFILRYLLSRLGLPINR